ncbi:hypothetical protein FAM09_22240 [Niastella caeni]|uniref:Uncharacterized protein n=1 Tax=Niastella caeni TaxID=2569763 RepID=A0A4V4H0D1_9BACT|nr:hypothetical protein [Niastella caeni]THU36106.1 hypothetical protein FAM09_22240 [Niastella caeni]
MKVVALLGNQNTGKSHAINVAYFFLLNNGFTQVPGHFRILGNPDFEDVFDILENGGKKVGIIGMGDYEKGRDSLKSLLNEMKTLGCTSVICSCQTRPNIEAAVRAYSPHVFVPKTPSAGPEMHRIVNVIDANTLIGHV